MICTRPTGTGVERAFVAKAWEQPTVDRKRKTPEESEHIPRKGKEMYLERTQRNINQQGQHYFHTESHPELITS
jgi:hypothetical protein